MDTRLLRSFLAVVRAGRVTAAAAELGFVQSTVTAHIQSLERMVGSPLLDRHPGGVRPTRAGSLFAEHARQILDLEDRMFTELTADAARPAGPVRLCAPESICAYRLAPLLPGVCQRLLLPTVTVADELATGRLTELVSPGLAGYHLWLAEPRSRWRTPAVQAVHAMVNDHLTRRPEEAGGLFAVGGCGDAPAAGGSDP